MTYKDSLLDRYDAVAALSERGVGGERANAEAIRADLERRYPGIARQSFIRQHGNGWAEAPEPTPLQEDAQDVWSTMADSALRWSFSMLHAEGVQDYAHRFVEIRPKWLASHKFQVAAKVPESDLVRLRSYLSPEQKALFCQEVGRRVAESLLAEFYDED